MQHMDHDRALLGQPFDPLPLLVDDSDQSLDLVPAVDEALDPHSDQDNMPNDEDADNERMVENLCRDLLAVPSETGATEQTVVRIAQIYAHRLFHILAPHDLALPDSMYMLRRKAGEDPKPGQNKKNDIWPLYDDFRPPRSTELVEIRVSQKGLPGPAKSSARWPDMLFSLKLVWVPPLGSPGACFRPKHPS